MPPTPAAALSIVIIGRNQAKLLQQCLESIKAIPLLKEAELIYIDTASTENNTDIAAEAGANVITINPPRPCAAIARNTGWKKSNRPFILFLDGDTLLDPHFVGQALQLFSDPAIGAVCGQRRERYPHNTPYQTVLDLDWIQPAGNGSDFGGDVIIRREALEQTGGYEESLIAGEDPELSRRIKAAGWKIVRLDIPMTLHDLQMRSFPQYWKRCFRTGYAYAEASRIGLTPPLWKKEAAHNLWKGTMLIVLTVAALAMLPCSWVPLAGWAVCVVFLIARTAWAARAKTTAWTDRLLYGIHAHFQHLPMLCGQIAYLAGQRLKLIDYH